MPMSEPDQTAPQPTATAAEPAGFSAADISRHVSSILDAVEREAARLREEARAEAAGYLADARRRADDLVAERQRRIAELSDELIAKSDAVIARLDDAVPVRQGFENLVRALGDAAERLAREADHGGVEFEPPPFGARPPVAARSQTAPPAQPPPIHPARAPAAPGWRGLGGTPAPTPTGWSERDKARAAAIQMAAAGATRAAVAEHLHRAFALVDPGTVLDEVFGPGSDATAQVPWIASNR